jgi:hypothetical protein
MRFSVTTGTSGPVTVAARSKAWTVFDGSDAVTVGSNPTQGMDIWCVCVCVYKCLFCVCADELITRPRSPTDCE